jgi:hypothetical protein
MALTQLWTDWQAWLRTNMPDYVDGIRPPATYQHSTEAGWLHNISL